MANRSKEEIAMENEILRKILFPCGACHGTGKLHDGLGNQWECISCKGFNVEAAKGALDV